MRNLTARCFLRSVSDLDRRGRLSPDCDKPMRNSDRSIKQQSFLRYLAAAIVLWLLNVTGVLHGLVPLCRARYS